MKKMSYFVVHVNKSIPFTNELNTTVNHSETFLYIILKFNFQNNILFQCLRNMHIHVPYKHTDLSNTNTL